MDAAKEVVAFPLLLMGLALALPGKALILLADRIAGLDGWSLLR